MGLLARRGPAIAPLVPAPKVADLPRPLLQSAGRYLGTLAGDEPVRTRGLGRAGTARLQLSAEGVDVVRLAGAFRIPADALTSAREDAAFGAARVGEQGALVIRWRHDGRVLDTGFSLQAPAPTGRDSRRPDLHKTHRDWSRAVAKTRQEH